MTATVLLVRGEDATPDVERGVLELLAAVDHEFVPRLSQRADTVSTAAVRHRTGVAPPTVQPYLRAMRDETWLVALDRHGVVGLLSFRAGYRAAVLETVSPSSYVTTVAVAPRARRTGVGTRLYDELERVARDDGMRHLTTRTWATNTTHLDLLHDRGFRVVAERADDRDGVGTIYLACAVPTHGPAEGPRADRLSPR